MKKYNFNAGPSMLPSYKQILLQTLQMPIFPEYNNFYNNTSRRLPQQLKQDRLKRFFFSYFPSLPAMRFVVLFLI